MNLKMLSAVVLWCIYMLTFLTTNISTDTNSVNIDHPAPTGAVLSWSTMFVRDASKHFSTWGKERHMIGTLTLSLPSI